MKLFGTLLNFINNVLTTQGDLVVRGVAGPERLAGVDVNQVLKSGGVGAKPAWGIDRIELTTQGDLLVKGVAVPERLAAVAAGQVLKSGGVGAKPAWGVSSMGDYSYKSAGQAGIEASQDVNITTTFRPGLMLFFAKDGTPGNMNWSVGISDGSDEAFLASYDDGTKMTNGSTKAIYILRAAGNSISGTVSAIIGSGFTITFTLAGVSKCDFTYFAIS